MVAADPPPERLAILFRVLRLRFRLIDVEGGGHEQPRLLGPGLGRNQKPGRFGPMGLLAKLAGGLQ